MRRYFKGHLLPRSRFIVPRSCISYENGYDIATRLCTHAPGFRLVGCQQCNPVKEKVLDSSVSYS